MLPSIHQPGILGTWPAQDATFRTTCVQSSPHPSLARVYCRPHTGLRTAPSSLHGSRSIFIPMVSFRNVELKVLRHSMTRLKGPGSRHEHSSGRSSGWICSHMEEFPASSSLEVLKAFLNLDEAVSMERGFNGEASEKESVEASSLCVDDGSSSLPSATKIHGTAAERCREILRV